MLKILCAGCFGLSKAILSLSQNVHCSHKLQKNTKNPYFEGSRSFMVIDVDKFKKLVTST